MISEQWLILILLSLTNKNIGIIAFSHWWVYKYNQNSMWFDHNKTFIETNLVEIHNPATCLICILNAPIWVSGSQSIHQFGPFTNSMFNSIKQSINMAELTSFGLTFSMIIPFANLIYLNFLQCNSQALICWWVALHTNARHHFGLIYTEALILWF